MGHEDIVPIFIIPTPSSCQPSTTLNRPDSSAPLAGQTLRAAIHKTLAYLSPIPFVVPFIVVGCVEVLPFQRLQRMRRKLVPERQRAY
jgi:hypothetical protein